MNCCLKFSNKRVGLVSNTSSPTSKRRSISKNDNRVVERNTLAPSSLRPLFEFKDKFRCLFCGGANCKHENWKNNPNTPIIGLHCDQITENLYASQRPSTMLIHQYNLIKKFKE